MLETFRDNTTGMVTVRGVGFSVVVQENGHITISSTVPFSVATLSPGANTLDVLCDDAESKAPRHAHDDKPSPRSNRTIRKRGAR